MKIYAIKYFTFCLPHHLNSVSLLKISLFLQPSMPAVHQHLMLQLMLFVYLSYQIQIKFILSLLPLCGW